jgi:hypothetical protein
VNESQLRHEALEILESAWQPELGYCVPHPRVYPHLWLWDSCFHSIAWTSLHDRRALREIEAIFAKQFRNGFVPHMIYYNGSIARGPRKDVSSFTQPPVYALALAWAQDRGMQPGAHLIEAVRRGLSYLLADRLRDGLAYVVHPWETGCDDSPRWDSWVSTTLWESHQWTEFDQLLVEEAIFSSDEGDATGSGRFMCSPSLFNGILAHGLVVAADLCADDKLRAAGRNLADAMEELLWSDTEGMYVDRPLLGGGPSSQAPTLDGVLTTLGTARSDRAAACLDQLRDPTRFAGPHGLRYLPRDHPDYRPDTYWRGSAWPQLTFLAVQACRRWGYDRLAADIGRQARSAIRGAGWAEHWDPESGQGLGAIPQTWATVAIAM